MAARTIDMTTAFVPETCINCGIAFGLPQDYADALRRNGKTFHCPNGHSMCYGKSESDRLREQLRAAEARTTAAQDQATAARRHADREARERQAAERSAAAYKGQATRLRNHIRNGMCPIAECGQSFSDLEAHMATHHPDFAEETTAP